MQSFLDMYCTLQRLIQNNNINNNNNTSVFIGTVLFIEILVSQGFFLNTVCMKRMHHEAHTL